MRCRAGDCFCSADDTGLTTAKATREASGAASRTILVVIQPLRPLGRRRLVSFATGER
jgi:hypothetical protein